MKTTPAKVVAMILFVSLLAPGQALADPELQRITAEQAFNAVQTQMDPTTGEEKKVMMVDVRTRAEYFWVGAASKVNTITLDNETIITPDLGKAVLVMKKLFIKINNKPRFLPLGKIKSMDLSPIATNIPLKLWDETTGTLLDNDDFKDAIEALALDKGVQVVIFFCRSGGRSQSCLAPFDNALFEAIYEIDQPNLESGYGGFEGTSYSNAYLGYRGYPGRNTINQEVFSVSWKDSGLPIKTSVNPLDSN